MGRQGSGRWPGKQVRGIHLVTSITDGHDPLEMPSFPLVFMKRCQSRDDLALVDIPKGVVFIEPVSKMLLGETFFIFSGISWNTLSVRHFGILDVQEPVDPSWSREEHIAVVFSHDHVMGAQLDALRLVRDSENACIYAGHVYKAGGQLYSNL